ncbi:MAG: hypothetical protein V3R38_00090 [bacterium]
MSTDPTSGSGNTQSFLGVTVTQQYPGSGLILPWHDTIITSATTLLWGDPGLAPEIVTLVQSPPFFKDRPVAAATWELICAPDVLPAEAFERVQQKAGRLISKAGLYLDPDLPEEEIARGRLRRPFDEERLHEAGRLLADLVVEHRERRTLGWLLGEAPMGGYLDMFPSYVRKRFISEMRKALGGERIMSLECPACGRGTVTRKALQCPQCGVATPADLFGWRHPEAGLRMADEHREQDAEMRDRWALEIEIERGLIDKEDPTLGRFVDLVLEEGLGLQETADHLGEETADVYRMRLRRRHKPTDRKD